MAVHPEGNPRGTGPGRAAVALQRADLGHGRSRVLRAIDASAPAEAHVLVVGDNGSGKSTLLQTLAGLLPKLDGEVAVLGLDPLEGRRALHARIGHLGHLDPFYPELTGLENLTFHARLRGLDESAARRGVDAVGLDSAARQTVAHYSHGMRRRLGLAKALLGDPELVLLDEPESGLDAKGRAVFRALLGRQRGRTVVLSTHHWSDWVVWADRVWALGAGRLHEVALQGDEGTRRAALEAALLHVGGVTP